MEKQVDKQLLMLSGILIAIQEDLRAAESQHLGVRTTTSYGRIHTRDGFGSSLKVTLCGV